MEEKKKSSLPIILAILGGAIIIGVFVLVGIKMSSPKEEAKQEEVKKEAKDETREPETDEEKQALKDVKEILECGGYSKKALIDVLQYEYEDSEEVSKYAAENCGADFKEEALEAAKEHLKDDYEAFSEESLLEQLTEFDGFTKEEARYGVENCGADYEMEAEEAIDLLLEYDSYSKQGLKNELEDQGFTQSEIKYALENADIDYNENALDRALFYDMDADTTRDLLETDGFTDEEIEYAINNM